MYVCTKCGNYKSFTVSIPETVTNKLEKVSGREYETPKYEEQSMFVKNDASMQEIEETLVCDECESMGVVYVPLENLTTGCQKNLFLSLGVGRLNKKLMKRMKKEANEQD